VKHSFTYCSTQPRHISKRKHTRRLQRVKCHLHHKFVRNITSAKLKRNIISEPIFLLHSTIDWHSDIETFYFGQAGRQVFQVLVLLRINNICMYTYIYIHIIVLKKNRCVCNEMQLFHRIFLGNCNLSCRVHVAYPLHVHAELTMCINTILLRVAAAIKPFAVWKRTLQNITLSIK